MPAVLNMVKRTRTVMKRTMATPMIELVTFRCATNSFLGLITIHPNTYLNTPYYCES
jgi:hypothetical protein